MVVNKTNVNPARSGRVYTRFAPTVSDIFSLKNVQFYKNNYFTIGVIVGYQG